MNVAGPWFAYRIIPTRHERAQSRCPHTSIALSGPGPIVWAELQSRVRSGMRPYHVAPIRSSWSPLSQIEDG
jgi:hypothetical protein